MAADKKPLVLITGLSGYCAASTALAFLNAGYRVRGTLRKEAQMTAWREKYAQFVDSGLLEFAVVPDMANPGCYEEAVKGVGIFCHMASPFFYGYTDNERDMLLPALRGTLEALESAHKAETVKQFILTSSFAAMSDYTKGLWPGKTYSENDWCPHTWEEAKNSNDQTFVYVTSKKYSEKAAWDFMAEKKPAFSLTSILPVHVIGRTDQPISSLDGLSTSAAWIRHFLDKPFLLPCPIPMMIDVSDVALAHLRAVEHHPTTAGQRYFVVGAEFSASAVAIAARKAFPDKEERFPKPGGEKGHEWPPHFEWDTSKAERDLGIRWKPLEQTVKEALEQVFELEEEEKAQTIKSYRSSPVTV
ncbi:hypothetical protein JCM11251_001052 [Rhodosporidiobolus azoricus]